MPASVHRVNRLVFEVTVADADAAPRIQARIAQVQRGGLARHLGDLLDAAAPGPAPVRIDRVTVDLGVLAADRLETELRGALPKALASALRAALPEAPSSGLADPEPGARHGAATGSELEIIDRLLTRAELPWWADPAHRRLLEEAVASADSTRPAALAALLRRLLADPVAARRAAMHLAPRTLERLVERLAAGRGGDARATAGRLIARAPLAGRRPLRAALWAAILRTAAGVEQPRLAFWRDAIARLAESNGLDMREQLTALREGADSGAAAQLLATLWVELPDPSADRLAGIEAHLARLPDAGGLFDLLARALGRRPAAGHALAPAIEAFSAALERRRSAAASPALTALLRQVRRLDLVPAGSLADALRRWAGRAGDVDPELLGALALDLERGELEATPPPRREHPGTVDEDGIEVINAGLVILWPFLATFFGRIELLAADAFRDRAAQDRAVGLLHYIATADADPPEYQLGLGKVLCGLHPADPWQAGETLDAAARAECDGLLDAVVARAPVLRSMSGEGLRGSFLLRRGMLRAEADGWLLVVARESFDVVLDRFPWPVGWVRLPWMPAALQVQW